MNYLTTKSAWITWRMFSSYGTQKHIPSRLQTPVIS